jgi:hypothetical protein
MINIHIFQNQYKKLIHETEYNFTKICKFHLKIFVYIDKYIYFIQEIWGFHRASLRGLHTVIWQLSTNILEEPVAAILRVASQQMKALSAKSKSKLLYDWQSFSTSWYRAPLWNLQPDIISCRNVAVWNWLIHTHTHTHTHTYIYIYIYQLRKR